MSASAVDQFEHAEASIARLASEMSAGALTATALTAAYSERIERLDRNGPELQTVIEMNPDAPDIATGLDRERADGAVRGPLHGIPILIKDNMVTADPMSTTAGSLALADCRPERDAGLVERLRAAGAVILGKTNLSEWANIRSSRSTSGWSARGGLTRNPYALDRNTSGSSSGSAAATTANLCAAAIGTETDGSIVSPASINGIVGIKPTVGLVSRDGIVPISRSQDTAGPMARTVADAAALLTVLAGPDPRDPATADAPSHDYTDFLDPGRLEGARLGVVRSHGTSHPGVVERFDATLADLTARGAVLVDDIALGLRGIGRAELTVLLHELKDGLPRWLAEFAPDAEVASLGDVVEWNRRHAEVEMPWFGQEHFVLADACGDLTSPDYLHARARCARLCRDEGIEAALAEHDLDALIAPTGGPAWRTDLVNGDSFTDGFATPAAVAGCPHLTVPMGHVSGLPVGISIVGPGWSEPLLIGLAHSIEQARQARRPPTFAPSIAGLPPGPRA